MFRWLPWKTRGKTESLLKERLAKLEADAAGADERTRAQLFLRAGELCAQEDRRQTALVYYGRAVDAYLNAGSLGPAAALCRKILRYAPKTVRVHCTLVCLAVQDPRLGDPREAIVRYVAASRENRTEKLTISRLRLIASAADDPELRRFIAEQLVSLGDGTQAQRILDELAREGAEGRGDARFIADEGQWEKLLRAMLADPDELWKHA